MIGIFSRRLIANDDRIKQGRRGPSRNMGELCILNRDRVKPATLLLLEPVMAEKLSPDQRSENMRKVRGRNTKPEVMVRCLLHRLGYRFRLHRRDLPGSPDIVLPKYKTVVFVHGCFWHGHSCRKGTLRPVTNAEFWARKIDGNIQRDQRNYAALRELGWRVLVVWQCQLKDGEWLYECLSKISRNQV